MHTLAYLIAMSVILGSCIESSPEPAESEVRGSSASPDDVASTSSPTEPSLEPADSLKPFSDRVVVFIEASSAEIELASEDYSEDDFGVVADDLMFYRATAHDYLEQSRLPVQTFTGRRALYFLVNGMVRRYDLENVATLDVIVLYDHDREPRIIAPNEIQAVDTYFVER